MRGGPRGEPERGTAMTNGYRESDSLIVSEKPSNKTGDNKPVAERVEKSGLAEGSPSKRNRGQTQSWTTLPNELERVRQAAQRDRKGGFTWKQMYGIAEQWLPRPFICHPYPLERMCVNTRSRSPVH